MGRLRILSLLFLFSSLLAISSPLLPADEVKDRIQRFRELFDTDQQKALEALKPVDDPRIVDVIAGIYTMEDTQNHITYDGLYMAADEVLMTAEGDAVFERMHHYLEPSRMSRVRFHFICVLERLAHPSTLPVLLKMAPREKDERIQFHMVRALGNYNDDDALIALFKLAKKALTVNVCLEAVDALSKNRGPNATELLLKLYNGKAPGQVRGAALNALFERKYDGVDSMLKSALKDSSPFVRLAACSIAAATGRDDLGDEIIACLSAKEWQLLSAAVRACGKLKLAKAVGPLIELWKRSSGRIEEDIHRALLKITGKSFGPDWRYWDNWFRSLNEPVKASDKEGHYIVYHGLKTRSKNIAFVIDRSGSMAEKVKSKHSGYTGEGAVVKGDTKLAMVKAELIRVVKSLPSDAKFNIVAFDNNVMMWRKGQVLATKKNKADAVRWVQSLTPGGSTNVYDALVEAFGRLTPGGKVNTEYKTGPDTIFLLSDGLPNTGTISKPAEILKAVRKMNRIRQVTIHTIGVGKLAQSFLKPLAEQNHGTYKLIAE